jgi:hypothetical protein
MNAYYQKSRVGMISWKIDRGMTIVSLSMVEFIVSSFSNNCILFYLLGILEILF